MNGVEDMTKKAEREERFTGSRGNNRYLELREKRPALVQRYIAEGKIDDPSKKYRLEDARAFDGECMDMCPEFERHEREYQNGLMEFEKIPGTNSVDHAKAVKRYRRSAADDEVPLPCDVRPPRVLLKTLNYLISLIPKHGLERTYSFIRDRMRAIRKDLTLQNIRGEQAIQIFEKIARYHILCAHELCEVIDIKQEYEQLGKSLQSLMEFYDEQLEIGQPSANEAEFRAYYLLHHALNQGIQARFEMKLSKHRPELLRDPKMQLAVSLRGIIPYYTDENVFEFSSEDTTDDGSRIVAVALESFAHFFSILESTKTPFLMACAVHPHFISLRRHALRAMSNVLYVYLDARNTYTPLLQIVEMLGYDNIEDLKVDLQYYELADNINGNHLILGKVKRIGSTRITANPGNFEEKRVSLKPTRAMRVISGKISASGSIVSLLNGIFPEEYDPVNIGVGKLVGESMEENESSDEYKLQSRDETSADEMDKVPTNLTKATDNNPFANVGFSFGASSNFSVLAAALPSERPKSSSSFGFQREWGSNNIEDGEIAENELQDRKMTPTTPNATFSFGVPTSNNLSVANVQDNNTTQKEHISKTRNIVKQETNTTQRIIKQESTFNQVKNEPTSIITTIVTPQAPDITTTATQVTEPKKFVSQTALRTFSSSLLRSVSNDLVFDEIRKQFGSRIMLRIQQKIIDSVCSELIAEESRRAIRRVNLARKLYYLAKEAIHLSELREAKDQMMNQWKDFSSLGVSSPKMSKSSSLRRIPAAFKRNIEEMDMDDSFGDNPIVIHKRHDTGKSRLNFVFSIKRLTTPWIEELSRVLIKTHPEQSTICFSIGLLDLSNKSDLLRTSYTPSIKQIFSLFLQDASLDREDSETTYSGNMAHHVYHIGNYIIKLDVLLLDEERWLGHRLDSIVFALSGIPDRLRVQRFLNNYENVANRYDLNKPKTSLTVILPEMTTASGEIAISLKEGASSSLLDATFAEVGNDAVEKLMSIFEHPYFVYQRESKDRRSSMLHLPDLTESYVSGLNIKFSQSFTKSIHTWGLRSFELFSESDPLGPFVIKEMRALWLEPLNPEESSTSDILSLAEFNVKLKETNTFLQRLALLSVRGCKDGILKAADNRNVMAAESAQSMMPSSAVSESAHTSSDVVDSYDPIFDDIMMPLPVRVPTIPHVRFNRRDFEIELHSIENIRQNTETVLQEWVKDVLETYGWIFSDYMNESTLDDDEELTQIQARVLSVFESFNLINPLSSVDSVSLPRMIPAWPVAQIILRAILYELSWEDSPFRGKSYNSPAGTCTFHRRPPGSKGFVYYEI